MKLEPWPKVLTRGELEPASGEWLHTNGAGAYAMSTVALMHTRRFHGLLVAALNPPLERHVVISHAETTVRVGKRSYGLSTHQFPDIAPTPGYRLLETFAQDPLPRWVFRLGQRELERTLCLVRGENALIGRYIWRGKHPARVMIRPLMPLRPIHDLRHEHGGFQQKVAMRRGEVSIQPVPQFPEVVFRHGGVFTGSPDWWRRFEYSEDMRRHVHFQEDMWTPGTFELELEPDVPNYLIVGVGPLPEGTAEERFAEAERALRAVDPGPTHSQVVRALAISAEQFRAINCCRPSVIGGYPWLGVATRDSLISLPGLFLCQGLIDEAKAVLRALVEHRREGLLLASVPDSTVPDPETSVDSSLWLFEAVRQLEGCLAPGDPFVHDVLYPVMIEIFERVLRAPEALVWVSDDGLVVTRSESTGLTWMDSRTRVRPVTPRWGLAIEMQALWYQGLRTLSRLANECGDELLGAHAHDLAERAEVAFRTRFWGHDSSYPYDCIDEVTGQTDDALRPNALIALSVAPELFETWQARAIVQRVKERLLTPLGVRSLDPEHPDYIGYYEGGMESRQAAYHQGVVWVYLLGCYARAALRLGPEDFELQMDLKDLLERAASTGPVLGQVAQVASGDPPQRVGGCPAQAWSVAELLRTLWQDLSL
jgi:predicted glycogen debranching enzyme